MEIVADDEKNSFTVVYEMVKEFLATEELTPEILAEYCSNGSFEDDNIKAEKDLRNKMPAVASVEEIVSAFSNCFRVPFIIFFWFETQLSVTNHI